MDIPDLTTLKRCSKCGETKPRDQFYKNKASKDGLAHWCKECRSAEAAQRYKRDTEKFKKNRDRWNAANPNYFRDYYTEHADHISARKKEWWQQHKERLNETQRARRAANPEVARARDKYRYHNDPARKAYQLNTARKARRSKHGKEIRQRSEMTRRARIVGSGGRVTVEEMTQIRLAQTDKQGRVRCWYCGVSITNWHVEHKLPLSRGGTHTASNICLSCPSCNSSKHTKTPQEWAGRLL